MVIQIIHGKIKFITHRLKIIFLNFIGSIFFYIYAVLSCATYNKMLCLVAKGERGCHWRNEDRLYNVMLCYYLGVFKPVQLRVAGDLCMSSLGLENGGCLLEGLQGFSIDG